MEENAARSKCVKRLGRKQPRLAGIRKEVLLACGWKSLRYKSGKENEDCCRSTGYDV
jgi:hypothetical protein